MSKKVKIVNNVNSSVGFYLNPTPESFRMLPKRGAFLLIDEQEVEYININQSIIEKGIVWIDDKDNRVKLGLETETGEKVNANILQHEEIVELVSGNYKKLEKVLEGITEKAIIEQFVEVARELNIDSRAKIEIIEGKSNKRIFEEKE